LRSTGSGKVAGPGLKLKTRVIGDFLCLEGWGGNRHGASVAPKFPQHTRKEVPFSQ
jgi:hypothetical protein